MVLHSKLQKPLTCVHQASPGSLLGFEEEQMMMMMVMIMLFVVVVVVVILQSKLKNSTRAPHV